jgi:uncharacterized protein (TIGR04255 family)
MGQPISGKHSIEAVAFVIEFEQPFSDATLERLLTLKDTLTAEYPSFTTTQLTQFKVENNKMSSSSSGIGGVFLQKLSRDGRPARTLRVQANAILVTCFGFDYDSWKKTFSKALADLSVAANVAADDQNPLSSIVLQVIDRFVGPSIDSYDISQVFNSESSFITKQAQIAGPLWHIHQGWFHEQAEITDANNLNILNLGTNNTPAGVITTIDHVAKINFISPRKASDAGDKDLLATVFNYLHDRNKNIVTDLLNADQCKAIKIC